MKTIMIEITNFCPFKCKSCYSDKNTKQMDFETFKFIINKLKKLRILEKEIIISGGEPFLNKDFVKMIEYCNEFDIYPVIFTSGITTRNLNKIKDKISSLNVTIKYPEQKYEEGFNGVPGSYEKKIQFLSKAFKLQIPIKIHFVVDKLNQYWYENMTYFVKSFNADLNILRFIPFNSEDRELFINNEDWIIFCEDIIRKRGINKRKDIWILSPFKKDRINCVAGIQQMCIDVNANVRNCVYCSGNFGNIIDGNIKEIFKKMLDNFLFHKKFIKNGGCLALT